MPDAIPLRSGSDLAPPVPPDAPAARFKDECPEPLLLDARQAAALCGVGRATWYRMVSAGRCPAPVRLSRGCVRWSRETLIAWIRMGCPARKEFEARRKAAGDANGRR
jgi:predicted DNA-binding transcriptional regulator AlpA